MTNHNYSVFLIPLPMQWEVWQAATSGGRTTALKMHNVVQQMADERGRSWDSYTQPAKSDRCACVPNHHINLRENTLGCVKCTNKNPLYASIPLRNTRHYISMATIKNNSQKSKNISGRMDSSEKNATKPPKKALSQSKRKKKSPSFLSIIFNFF